MRLLKNFQFSSPQLLCYARGRNIKRNYDGSYASVDYMRAEGRRMFFEFKKKSGIIVRGEEGSISCQINQRKPGKSYLPDFQERRSVG